MSWNRWCCRVSFGSVKFVVGIAAAFLASQGCSGGGVPPFTAAEEVSGGGASGDGGVDGGLNPFPTEQTGKLLAPFAEYNDTEPLVVGYTGAVPVGNPKVTIAQAGAPFDESIDSFLIVFDDPRSGAPRDGAFDFGLLEPGDYEVRLVVFGVQVKHAFAFTVVEAPAGPGGTTGGDGGTTGGDGGTTGGDTGAVDNCPEDPGKTEPMVCGCEVPDVDSDNDGKLDCQEIKVASLVLAAGETIRVDYFDLPSDPKAWIGVFKAGTTHSEYLTFRLTDGKASGQMSFPGRVAGNYEVRLFFQDSYRLEAVASFRVE